MDILSLFVVVPVITILVLVFAKGLKQARQVSMVGSLIQLGMAINLVFAYFKERAINEEIMVFTVNGWKFDSARNGNKFSVCLF